MAPALGFARQAALAVLAAPVVLAALVAALVQDRPAVMAQRVLVVLDVLAAAELGAVVALAVLAAYQDAQAVRHHAQVAKAVVMVAMGVLANAGGPVV